MSIVVRWAQPAWAGDARKGPCLLSKGGRWEMQGSKHHHFDALIPAEAESLLGRAWVGAQVTAGSFACCPSLNAAVLPELDLATALWAICDDWVFWWPRAAVKGAVHVFEHVFLMPASEVAGHMHALKQAGRALERCSPDGVIPKLQEGLAGKAPRHHLHVQILARRLCVLDAPQASRPAAAAAAVAATAAQARRRGDPEPEPAAGGSEEGSSSHCHVQVLADQLLIDTEPSERSNTEPEAAAAPDKDDSAAVQAALADVVADREALAAKFNTLMVATRG